MNVMLIKKHTVDNISERNFIGQCLTRMAPPSRESTREWAESNRFLGSDITSRPGRMNCMETPWMLYVMECLDNPLIPVIVGKKSAQIAWTETINNFLGRTIDLDPRNIMIAFPRAKSAQKFYKEKLKPFIESTNCLNTKIGSLKRISHLHIPYPGGFLVLATTGSADDLKSSVIPVIIVEEPDGVKADVNNQGDGMALLQQRMKSFDDPKLIYAGTPTDMGFSQVNIAYEASNRMNYMVPCHLCNNFHTLSFDNLHCDPFQDRSVDELYGKKNPQTAYYLCPHCEQPWTFEEKNNNVKEAINYFNMGWEITRPEVKHVYGFAFNELLSSFSQSSFISLAKQRLRAQVKYDQGEDGLMKSFVNNSEGNAYQPMQSGVDVEELRARQLDYPELIVPYEGLILTAGIDVQHNRFAIIVRAWGRNGNSWLVTWTEIFGDVLEREDEVWVRLTEKMLQEWEHGAGGGRTLRIAALTIDSADGNTTELVYNWVLEMSQVHNHVFAGKGRGEGRNTNYEIFNEPGAMDADTVKSNRKSLAETMGVNVFEIGAYRAHSEVLRRVNLNRTKDRFYHCKTEYGLYEEGLLSCVKRNANDNTNIGYEKKTGHNKEVIDCEKMALHAAYAIRIRSYTNKRWTAIENHLHAAISS